MALPTREQCKLSLSFNMAAKTMTVSLNPTYLNPAINIGLKSFGTANAKITDPIGNEYLIDLSGTDIPYSYNGSQTFPCTLDSNGNVLNGFYSILVGSFNLNYQGNLTTYTDIESSFTLNYVAPTVVINQSYNVVEPSFISTDITDYRVTDPLTQGFVIPVTVSYSHNLYFPVNSSGYPNNAITTSVLSIARGAYEFYYGTQTGSVVHNVSYTFSDGLVVTDTITGALETLVNPATDICSVVCGLNKLYSVMEANKNLNRTQYLLNKAEYEFLLAKTANAQANITCGNSEQAQTQINDIKASLGDCCNDCATYTDGDLVNGVGNPVFPYTPENVINKSQNIIADATSSIKYPSVSAIKNYVDSNFQISFGNYTPENVANKSTNIILNSGSNTKYPTIKAVEDYAQPILGYDPEALANKTQDILASTGSSTDYPSVAAIENYAEKLSNKSTDSTFSANSNTLYPSQRAVKSYADSLVVGLLRDRGNYDASIPPYLYPSTGGSGIGGAVKEGDLWYISVDGNLGSNSVLVGYSVRALVDNPGQTDANWSILNAGLGYIPEDIANKSQDIDADTGSSSKYPSVVAVEDYIESKTSLSYRGFYDISGGSYPSTGGSGSFGAIRKGDMWDISVGGNPSGGALMAGDSIIARQNNPGNIGIFWIRINKALGYTPENASNKTNDMLADAGSTTKYPSVFGVEDYVYQTSQSLADLSQDISADTGSTSKYPSVKAVEDYVSLNSSNLQQIKVSVTASQILNSASTPIELIPAQINGKIIVIHKIVTVFNPNTTPYSTNQSMYVFGLGYGVISNVLNSATTRISQWIGGNAGNTLSSYNLSNVYLYNLVAPTLGDGTLDVYLTYEIITL